MLGYIYLILATLLGREITRPLLPEQRIQEKEVISLLDHIFRCFRVRGIVSYLGGIHSCMAV